MSGWEAAFYILLTAIAAFAVGTVAGIRLERAGRDIEAAIRRSGYTPKDARQPAKEAK